MITNKTYKTKRATLICFAKYEFTNFVLFIAKIREPSVKMFATAFVSTKVVHAHAWDDLIRSQRHHLPRALTLENHARLRLSLSNTPKRFCALDDGGLHAIHLYFTHEARGVAHRVFVLVEDVCHVESGDIDQLERVELFDR